MRIFYYFKDNIISNGFWFFIGFSLTSPLSVLLAPFVRPQISKRLLGSLSKRRWRLSFSFLAPSSHLPSLQTVQILEVSIQRVRRARGFFFFLFNLLTNCWISTDAQLYRGETFTCKDGSKTIEINRVNDDYCDCETDGSDEPGTSACSNGQFYCQNLRHKSELISSSRVNDGICGMLLLFHSHLASALVFLSFKGEKKKDYSSICRGDNLKWNKSGWWYWLLWLTDCCDGSDEFAGKVKCADTCYKMGEQARINKRKELDEYKKVSVHSHNTFEIGFTCPIRQFSTSTVNVGLEGQRATYCSGQKE